MRWLLSWRQLSVSRTDQIWCPSSSVLWKQFLGRARASTYRSIQKGNQFALQCELTEETHTFNWKFPQVDLIISYRYGTIFREAIKPPRFEWCSSVDTLSTNIYMKTFYQLLKNKAPQMFRKCPYRVMFSGILIVHTKSISLFRSQGQLEMTNVTFDTSKYPAIFPQGIYKTSLNVSTVDGQLGWGYYVHEVTSTLKHSFRVTLDWGHCTTEVGFHKLSVSFVHST